MADGDIVSSRAECDVDEIHITVEADTVGAGDNVDSRRHRLSKRVALVAGLVMRNVLAMGNLSLSSQFLGKVIPPSSCGQKI